MILLIVVTVLLVLASVTWFHTPVGHDAEYVMTALTVTLFIAFLLLSALVATGVLD